MRLPGEAARLEDHALVVRARSGNADALEDLLRATRTAVLRYCRARLHSYAGGAETAQDVTQEICLAVIDVLPRYIDTGAPFAALVYRIAANKVADEQRRHARNPVHAVDDVPEQTEPAAGPEQRAMIRRDVAAARKLLDTLLAELPPAMARVVRLRSDGLSPDEVALIVGATANSVRVTHHRGLARLRQLANTT